jgi:hypothetical protein
VISGEAKIEEARGANASEAVSSSKINPPREVTTGGSWGRSDRESIGKRFGDEVQNQGSTLFGVDRVLAEELAEDSVIVEARWYVCSLSSGTLKAKIDTECQRS